MEEDKCLRCGQCCYMPDANGNLTTEPCRYLVFDDDGKTSCGIYENRLGTKLSGNSVCGFRSNDRFDYEGCPYNSGDKPVFRVSKKRVRRVFGKKK